MENKSKRPFPPTTPPAYAPAGSQTGLFLSEWQSTLTNTHQHSHTHPIKILSGRVKEFQPKSFHSTGQSSVFFSRHGPQSFWPLWVLLFTYLLILSSCSHSFFTVSVILLIRIREKKNLFVRTLMLDSLRTGLSCPLPSPPPPITQHQKNLKTSQLIIQRSKLLRAGPKKSKLFHLKQQCY